MLKMQLIHNACKIFLHKYSTVSSAHVLEKLITRSLVRVSGNDASALLQGLITNDMKHLEHGVGSMFAMFLNSKGRVLYDTIVYRMPEESTYYLEVDKQVADLVQKHLNIYRLRRKIEISLIDDQFTVWAHFNPSLTQFKPDESNLIHNKPENVSFKEIGHQKLLIFKDPRLVHLGSRILVPTDCNSQLPEYFNSASSPSYKWYRYRLGVGEGIDELPVGNCFPLEVNCDYLHGVSFHKGCYIGQELTARVHHTGVVRKRLMPLVLQSTFKKPPEKDEAIKSGDANIGKLRGYKEDAGLGLLRIEKTLVAKELIVNNTVVKTAKPNWWPIEAPKEKMSAKF